MLAFFVFKLNSMKKVFFLMTLLVSVSKLYAQDGQLDLSFNSTGKVISNFGAYNASLSAVPVSYTHLRAHETG
jgi:hypothetical protein